MHPSVRFPVRGVIVRRQAEALRRMGHNVEFVELGDRGGPLRYVTAQSRVRRAIRAFQPHVLHVHFGYSILAVPPTGTPIVTTFYGDDLQGTARRDGRVTFKSRFGTLVSQYAGWRSKRLITISAILRDRLMSRSLRDRTSVIRDAVDPTLFRPLARDAARQRLAIPERDLLVIFPHDVTQPTKRLWLAQAALAKVQERLPAARLWVVNGVATDEMPWYYGAADALIVTSQLEGGPSSAKEALACGIPVVSVPVGDVQLATDAPEGFRLAAADAEALAAALVAILPGRGGERHSFLPEHLTLVKAAERLTAVYREALTS